MRDGNGNAPHPRPSALSAVTPAAPAVDRLALLRARNERLAEIDQLAS